MFLRTLLISIFCYMLVGIQAPNAIEKPKEKPIPKNFATSFYPKSSKKDQLIKHTAFTLCYSEEHEQALWVAYRLTADMCNSNEEERTDNFREDPLVKTKSAIPDDYKKTNFDRGHLCPAGDMAWSEVTMSESFYMSNMSPQEPKFNRGIWKKLEGEVREWAKKNEEIYIVTAGVLTNVRPETIGENKVSIPNFYYKVLLDVKKPYYKAIAFILPNEGSKKELFEFAVSIDSVEKLTGINFFPTLPDAIENNLEAQHDVTKWY